MAYTYSNEDLNQDTAAPVVQVIHVPPPPTTTGLEILSGVSNLTVKGIAFTELWNGSSIYYVLRNAKDNSPLCLLLSFANGRLEVLNFDSMAMIFHADNALTVKDMSKLCFPPKNGAGQVGYVHTQQCDRFIGYVDMDRGICDKDEKQYMRIVASKLFGGQPAYGIYAYDNSELLVSQISPVTSQRSTIIRLLTNLDNQSKALIICLAIKIHHIFYKATYKNLIQCNGIPLTIKGIVEKVGSGPIIQLPDLLSTHNQSKSNEITTDLHLLSGLKDVYISKVANIGVNQRHIYTVNVSKRQIALIIECKLTPREIVYVKDFSSLRVLFHFEPLIGWSKTSRVHVVGLKIGSIENSQELIDQGRNKVMFVTSSRGPTEHINSTKFKVLRYGQRDRPPLANVMLDNTRKRILLRFGPESTLVEWRAMIVAMAMRNIYNVYSLFDEACPTVSSLEEVIAMLHDG